MKDSLTVFICENRGEPGNGKFVVREHGSNALIFCGFETREEAQDHLEFIAGSPLESAVLAMPYRA